MTQLACPDPGVVIVDGIDGEWEGLAGRLPRCCTARLGFSDGWIDLPDPAEWRFWISELRQPARLALASGGSSWHESLTRRSVHGPTDLAEAVHRGARVFLFCHSAVLDLVHRRDYRYNPLYWLGEKLIVEAGRSSRVVSVDEDDPVARRLFGPNGPRLQLPLEWSARVEGARCLARTASGRAVACRLDRGRGSLYILPPFEETAHALELLAEEILPEAFPHAYPDGEVRDWIDDETLDCPAMARLRDEERRLRDEWAEREHGLRRRILEERREDAAAKGLLHGATWELGEEPEAPALVDCLASILPAFGLEEIRLGPALFPSLRARSPEGDDWTIGCLACRGALDERRAEGLLRALGHDGPRLAVLNPWRCRDARQRPRPLGLAPRFEAWRRETGGSAITSLAVFTLYRQLQLATLSRAEARERLVAGSLLARLE